jgi:DNA-binding XRE family transcriptional regulator
MASFGNDEFMKNLSLTKEGYTQDEIAKYIGMSQSTISLDLDKIEKEKRLK